VQQEQKRTQLFQKRTQHEKKRVQRLKKQNQLEKKVTLLEQKRTKAAKHKVAKALAASQREQMRTQLEQKRTLVTKRKAAKALAAAKAHAQAEHAKWKKADAKWKQAVKQQKLRTQALLATFKYARNGSKKMAKVMEAKAESLAASVMHEQTKMKAAVRREQERAAAEQKKSAKATAAVQAAADARMQAEKVKAAKALDAAEARRLAERRKWKKIIKRQKKESLKMLASFKHETAALRHDEHKKHLKALQAAMHKEHLKMKKALQRQRKWTQAAKHKYQGTVKALKHKGDVTLAAANARVQAEHLKWKKAIKQQKMRKELLQMFRKARAGSKKMALLMEHKAEDLAAAVQTEHSKLMAAVKREQQRTKAEKVRSAKVIKAADARVLAERRKWQQTVKHQKVRSQKLLATFKNARTASKHMAKAMLMKAEKIAAAADKMKKKLSKIKKHARREVTQQVARAKRKELMKMVAAQTRTAEAAAEAVIRARRQASIEKAKLIVKYTGAVPTNLGNAAMKVGENERKKQVAIVSAAKDKKAVKALKVGYVGCFSDRLDDRDLPHHMLIPAANPAQCASMCQAMDKSLAYAALQHGNQCFCGASYGKHGREPPATCFMRCKESPSKRCGGISRNSVYHVLTGVNAAPVGGK